MDDNDDGLEMLRTFFRSCGAEVLAARNAATALAYFQTTRFDALVSDLSMPGGDGLALIRAVRTSSGPERTIPAIALTGLYEDFAHGAAREAGFDAFLRRPVNFEELCQAVRDLVDSRRGSLS